VALVYDVCSRVAHVSGALRCRWCYAFPHSRVRAVCGGERGVKVGGSDREEEVEEERNGHALLLLFRQ